MYYPSFIPLFSPFIFPCLVFPILITFLLYTTASTTNKLSTMPTPNSQVLSTDAVDAPEINTGGAQHTRSHPPRLQHSPSLPNIWFPPHSGPLPPKFAESTRDGLRRPSTPPLIMANLPTFNTTPPEKNPDPTSSEQQESSAGPPSTCTPPKIQPPKIQRRRRIERENQHSLLTPPLTPSSSIRTTASIESTTHERKHRVPDGNESLVDIDTQDSTRFLLVSEF